MQKNNETILDLRKQKTKQVGSVWFSTLSENDLLETIDHTIQMKGNILIAHANTHFVTTSEYDINYRQALNRFDIVQPDGIGVHIAIKMLYPFQNIFLKRQNGTDLYFRLIKKAHEQQWKVFFLGDTETTLTLVQTKISTEYPGIKIVGVHQGFFDIDDISVVQNIVASQPDIVMVGMGVPRQELWLAQYAGQLKVPVAISVGAGLRFIAGKNIRAPKCIRFFGLEWLFRLLQEPRRLWQRYLLGIPIFCYLIMKQKFVQQKNDAQNS